MRRIRYQVAMSLDGYIAGPKGEYDWITGGEDFDFNALYAQFDTLLMGRGTFDIIRDGLHQEYYAGKELVVVSRTLRQEDHPGVTIVSGDVGEHVDALRAREGKDIWLFGGGELLRTLLEMQRVDTVELAVVPILLGGGIPMLAVPAPRTPLTLTGHHLYQGGMVLLEYRVERAAS
jgi:dihydrofolate reductase